MALVKNSTSSKLPYELLIGWRYTRAGRVAGRNGFISFISGVSMLGIALGVAALIIVLSVMNGFQKEVRDRMLAVVAHIELLNAGGEGFADVNAIMAQAKRNASVVAAAPFVAQQALMARGDDMRGALVRGIEPELETQVTDFTLQLPPDVRSTLTAGSFNVVLGGELAHALGVRVGDRVTLVAPGGQVTPAGVMPRLKQLNVTGLFDSGHYEYDATLVLMHLEDAQRIFRLEFPSGVRLKLKDGQRARSVASELAADLGPEVIVRDWTRQNRTWFAAVQVEKRMMFII
jgi:lipoprotein-releasing system permease protein